MFPQVTLQRASLIYQCTGKVTEPLWGVLQECGRADPPWSSFFRVCKALICNPPHEVCWFLLQRLKAAVHYTVGCLCQEVASDKEVPLSKQTIAAIAEVTFRQCGMEPRPSCICADAPKVAFAWEKRGGGCWAASPHGPLSLDTARDSSFLGCQSWILYRKNYFVSIILTLGH